VCTEEYSKRVASRLMGKAQIYCVEDSVRGPRFVALCPECGAELILTMGERDNCKMYHCDKEFSLIPYKRSMGLRQYLGLRNYLKNTGVQDWDRILSWEEYYSKEAERVNTFLSKTKDMETR